MDAEAVRKTIHVAIRSIPRGRVAAYGDVARRAGLPGRARLVGRVLREAPASAKLPWHRVLRADGRLAFPEGSEACETQRKKLLREGVEFLNGRVAGRFFAWREDDLDAALWAPER